MLTTGAGPNLTEIDTSGQSGFQGKKTFQFKITGVANSAFELEDISFIFRELIVS